MALLVVGIWVFLLVMRLGWLLVVMLSLRLSMLCFRSLLFSVLVVWFFGCAAIGFVCFAVVLLWSRGCGSRSACYVLVLAVVLVFYAAFVALCSLVVWFFGCAAIGFVCFAMVLLWSRGCGSRSACYMLLLAVVLVFCAALVALCFLVQQASLLLELAFQ